MTPGQQRAVLELQRLHAASEGGFDFLLEDTPPASKWLIVMISLRIGPIAKREGGIDLHDREEFFLLLPPDFPFTPPGLMVAHERFARFPHVVWSNTLCLYQSKIEWNPAHGLFGFFERLNLWLAKAAINEMDPIEGPLEPPHHVTDYSQVPFVVRADVPVPAGERWLGFAALQKHANRHEIVAWCESLEDWSNDRSPALAVFLPEALPMEFPRKGADLFALFERQGFDRERLLRHLAFASLLTAEGSPGYMIVGLPMRRAHNGTLRVHVAVWSISAERAKCLRNVLGDDADTERIRELRQAFGQALMDAFAESEISWCRVMEDRSEIVVRRDASTPLTWFSDRRVLVLGCGALGSWAAELIVRSGAAAVDVVDNGNVNPGLLVRQNFVQDDIGMNKAKALAPRLQAVARPGAAIRPFESEAHAFVMGDRERFAGYDVVIDCTASNITQMLLERDWREFQRRTPAFVSMITDAHAAHGLCVVLPPGSEAGPWDAFVRLKHSLCSRGDRREIVDAFYGAASLRGLFQPEPGCSDPTFIGSAADVACIAARALNHACQVGLGQQASIGLAFTASGITDVVPLPEMHEHPVGEYRVRLSAKVACEARAWSGQNARVRTPAHETGGLLWGLWDDAVRVIWVFDASGPPPDSRHDPAHFLCGVAGTSEEHQRRLSLTHGTSGFVGFWHTHPDMPSRESGTDIHGMTNLVSTFGLNQKRALMLIFGRSNGAGTAGVYLYESRAVTTTGELVSAGEWQFTLERAVV